MKDVFGCPLLEQFQGRYIFNMRGSPYQKSICKDWEDWED